ncbi:MAG: LytTR family DNA-binding domain-containing protein [Bacteroides sp.]
MNNVSAVIIEDEIPAARLLHSMVKRLRPDWQLTILPGNIEEAVKWFDEHSHPDVIFLDIQLSDGNSFDFVAEAKPSSTIIFTTAYDEYAIRAFSVNSIDYILKPVDEERLKEAIGKYEASLGRTSMPVKEYLDNIIESLSKPIDKRYRTRFLISGTDKFTTLQVSDIAYFYSENRITTAVCYNGKEQFIDLSLDKLSEQLDSDKFFRANRQFIIGIDSIKKIEPYFNNKVVVLVTPVSKEKILVSREKITSFKMWLNY